MKTQHTPGPWKSTRTVGGGWAVVATSLAYNVLDHSAPDPINAQANASLIAAAPDLLEACKRAAPWLGRMIADGNHKGCVMPNDCERTLELIEAAITKATGGQV